MLRKLKKLRNPIRVGLVGAGAMGRGIAHQISITPGMALEWVASRTLENARRLAGQCGGKAYGDDPEKLLLEKPVDVLVEATDSVWAAYRYCEAALENGAHVVLMNAQVDLVFGPRLCHLAASKNLIVTSDAGDQHGVLATMIQEIQLWGFDIVQAGNVKGFLNRHATSEDLIEEAAKRNLSLVQCCAFTDGTKLNIEMALLANAFNLPPAKVGMTGPTVARVDQALEAFDPEELAKNHGSVDYILGARPGGGVYVIGRCDSPIQKPYLEYYKIGQGPYYLFQRDYHLCHLETTSAIARVMLYGEPVLQPWTGRITDVYAFAKRNLSPGTTIPRGIGGDHFYGLIAETREARAKNWVPISLLDSDDLKATLRGTIRQDEPLTWNHLESYPSTMTDLYNEPVNQQPL